jgi:hypothetical protein
MACRSTRVMGQSHGLPCVYPMSTSTLNESISNHSGVSDVPGGYGTHLYKLQVCTVNVQRFPGLSDEYYQIHRRRMVTRSMNVIIRIQEGQRVHMEIPEPFQCPLSYEWLVEPVITPGGNTYSRAEIQRWVATSPTDPLTREPLTVDQLIPNRAMADVIEFYRRETARISIMC